MELIAVFPDPPPPDLAPTPDLAGYHWKSVATADDAPALRVSGVFRIGSVRMPRPAG